MLTDEAVKVLQARINELEVEVESLRKQLFVFDDSTGALIQSQERLARVYGDQEAFNEKACSLITRAARALQTWDVLDASTRKTLAEEMRNFAALPSEALTKGF